MYQKYLCFVGHFYTEIFTTNIAFAVVNLCHVPSPAVLNPVIFSGTLFLLLVVLSTEPLVELTKTILSQYPVVLFSQLVFQLFPKLCGCIHRKDKDLLEDKLRSNSLEREQEQIDRIVRESGGKLTRRLANSQVSIGLLDSSFHFSINQVSLASYTSWNSTSSFAVAYTILHHWSSM